MQEITVSAAAVNIEKVTDFVNKQLDLYSCPQRAKAQIDVAIDEIFGNIAQYAYTAGEGAITVRAEVCEEPFSVILTFCDSGRPYNPLEAAEPDTSLSAEERTVGGLGIFMVKHTMDEIAYEYKNGQNILTVKKALRREVTA